MACSFWNFGRDRWLADLRGAQLGVFFQCSILSSPLLEKEGPRYFLYLYSSLRCYQIYFDSCARTSTRVCHSVLTNCMCCSSWFRPLVMVGTSSCCLLACNVWTILNSSFFFYITRHDFGAHSDRIGSLLSALAQWVFPVAHWHCKDALSSVTRERDHAELVVITSTSFLTADTSSMALYPYITLVI